MEQITQLKTMRDDALARLQANPDFKLANSLDALITDLESVLQPPAASGLEVETQATVDDLSNADTVGEDETADISVPREENELAAVVMSTGDSGPENVDVVETDGERENETVDTIDALEAELSQGEDANMLPSGDTNPASPQSEPIAN